jgi:hypothetical protein
MNVWGGKSAVIITKMEDMPPYFTDRVNLIGQLSKRSDMPCHLIGFDAETSAGLLRRSTCILCSNSRYKNPLLMAKNALQVTSKPAISI